MRPLHGRAIPRFPGDACNCIGDTGNRQSAGNDISHQHWFSPTDYGVLQGCELRGDRTGGTRSSPVARLAGAGCDIDEAGPTCPMYRSPVSLSAELLRLRPNRELGPDRQRRSPARRRLHRHLQPRPQQRTVRRIRRRRLAQPGPAGSAMGAARRQTRITHRRLQVDLDDRRPRRNPSMGGRRADRHA